MAIDSVTKAASIFGMSFPGAVLPYLDGSNGISGGDSMVLMGMYANPLPGGTAPGGGTYSTWLHRIGFRGVLDKMIVGWRPSDGPL